MRPPLAWFPPMHHEPVSTQHQGFLRCRCEGSQCGCFPCRTQAPRACRLASRSGSGQCAAAAADRGSRSAADKAVDWSVPTGSRQHSAGSRAGRLGRPAAGTTRGPRWALLVYPPWRGYTIRFLNVLGSRFSTTPEKLIPSRKFACALLFQQLPQPLELRELNATLQFASHPERYMLKP